LFAAILASGCQTHKEEDKTKLLSTLRLHLEVVPDMMDFSTPVPVYRAKPVMVNVDKDAFLTEANVEEAKVVDAYGGYDLQIKFNREGRWIWENYTTSNVGRHVAIFSQFGKSKAEARWLGAPVIARRSSNGILVFTPDATREEADRIVLGLNNAARKAAEATKW
jgi:preprotein translocase subunit SecD